jgi:hypothetical protein
MGSGLYRLDRERTTGPSRTEQIQNIDQSDTRRSPILVAFSIFLPNGPAAGG